MLNLATYNRIANLSLDDLAYLSKHGTPDEKVASKERLKDLANLSMRQVPAINENACYSLSGDELID